MRRLLTSAILAGSVFAVLGCTASRSPSSSQTSVPGSASPLPEPEDIAAVGRALETDGLPGWIHGSVPERHVWVFTYRKPNDFFSSIDLSVVPATEVIARALSQLGRHDRVEIRGTVLRKTPPIHVRVDAVRVVETWRGRSTLPAERSVRPFPEALETPGDVVARVHAVGDMDGPMLVVDVLDTVVPVRVPDASELEGLYRGDIVRMTYVIATHPKAPTHWELDRNAEDPLEILDAIVAGHGAPIEKVGALVLFPQSPQIAFDVYALQSMDAHGIAREYTLVNFDDPAMFSAIREKLAKAWREHAGTATHGRNKEVNPTLCVRATGIKNVVAPNQANPQILLDSPDDLEFFDPSTDAETPCSSADNGSKR